MEWLRAHSYLSALCAAGVLILIGIFIVNAKSPAAPSNSQPLAWGGTGAILNPPPATNTPAQQNPSGIIQQVQDTAPYTYIPVGTPSASSGDTDAANSFDIDAFLAMLAKESAAATGTPAQSSSATNAYAFIPGGLISTTTPSTKRTPLQQALYDYGNDVGSFIQSFEEEHTNQAQVLMDQAQDRANTDKAAAVEQLGGEFVSLGNALLTMDSVPPQMASAHTALANSYVEIGTKLALVPKAQRDSDYVTAVETYDASADTFTKNYVALAQLFSAYGVTFAPGDAGSVFTFTSIGL